MASHSKKKVSARKHNKGNKKKVKELNYNQKRSFIAKYDEAPKNKSAITKKYNELKQYAKKSSGLKFVKPRSKKELSDLKKAGALVTRKGVFIRARKGISTRHKRGILIEFGGIRTEYLIPLDKMQIAALFGDPEAVVRTLLEGEYSWILREHPGEKYYVRLVFPLNDGGQDLTMARLNYYLTQGIHDVPDTRTGKIKKSAKRKKLDMARNMVGLKIIFFETEGKEFLDIEEDGEDEESDF